MRHLLIFWRIRALQRAIKKLLLIFSAEVHQHIRLNRLRP